MTLLSRVFGLIRDVTLANVFGVTGGTDAFLVAFKIPNFMRRLFAEGSFSLAFVPVLSEPDEDWQGRRGWVHAAVVEDFPDLSAFDLYMAGPPPMIEAARTLFPRHGLVAERLFFDSFDYAQPRGDTPV